jgi:hypothetical protein
MTRDTEGAIVVVRSSMAFGSDANCISLRTLSIVFWMSALRSSGESIWNSPREQVATVVDPGSTTRNRIRAPRLTRSNRLVKW